MLRWKWSAAWRRLHFDLMPAHDIPLGRFVVACSSWGIQARDALALLAGSSPASAGSAVGLAAIAAACVDAGVDPHTIEHVRAASPAAARGFDVYLTDHGWRVVSLYLPRVLALVELPDVLVRAIRAASTRAAVTRPDSGALRARVPATDRGRFDELAAEARATDFIRDDNVALTSCGQRALCAGRCSKSGGACTSVARSKSAGMSWPSAKPRLRRRSPATRRSVPLPPTVPPAALPPKPTARR